MARTESLLYRRSSTTGKGILRASEYKIRTPMAEAISPHFRSYLNLNLNFDSPACSTVLFLKIIYWVGQNYKISTSFFFAV
eukprot:SAG31_NODE_17356_length_674_cov_0.853913_1_plen_80_part_01